MKFLGSFPLKATILAVGFAGLSLGWVFRQEASSPTEDAVTALVKSQPADEMNGADVAVVDASRSPTPALAKEPEQTVGVSQAQEKTPRSEVAEKTANIFQPSAQLQAAGIPRRSGRRNATRFDPAQRRICLR